MIMLIFEDGEEAVIQNILSMVGTKARVCDEGLQDKCTLAFHGLVLDELQHIVLCEGRKVELTSIEFEILDLLARHPGVVFGREQIYSAVWKESGDGDYQIVMNHIHNIWEKIGDDPAKPVYTDGMGRGVSVFLGKYKQRSGADKPSDRCYDEEY